MRAGLAAGACSCFWSFAPPPSVTASCSSPQACARAVTEHQTRINYRAGGYLFKVLAPRLSYS